MMFLNVTNELLNALEIGKLERGSTGRAGDLRATVLQQDNDFRSERALLEEV